MSQLNPWFLFGKWVAAAPIYLKREWYRLAEWTGLGHVVAIVLSAAFACAVAAALTLVRGHTQAGSLVLSMVLGLGLTTLVLICIISLRTPGGVENHYAA